VVDFILEGNSLLIIMNLLLYSRRVYVMCVETEAEVHHA